MKNISKTRYILGKYLSLFIITLLVISPSFVLAKNNEKKEGERREIKTEKVEKKENQINKTSNTKKCFQAWGHLIALGWIKWNGSSTLLENCIMPFGINKKFGNINYNNSTTTSDTTAPIITNIVSTPNIYSAVLSWNTDEKSDTKVFYSTTSPVNISNSNTYTKSNLLMTKNHIITLGNLSANTTYYVLLQSKDLSGNTATSSQISFTTLVAPTDNTAPIISYVVATVGTTTVSAGWKTNENTTTKMYYSKTTPIDPLSSTTLFVENNSLIKNHFISAFNLSTSTTYYILLESKDLSGNIQRTDEFSIITSSGI